MKWWYWLVLELLIVFGVMAWVYFFPEDALAKGGVGLGIFWLVEECKEINRRNKMTVEQNKGENRLEIIVEIAEDRPSLKAFKEYMCNKYRVKSVDEIDMTVNEYADFMDVFEAGWGAKEKMLLDRALSRNNK